jgi:hypothetical protein
MASVYKSFTSNDTTNTRTLLHESIPVTGSIISGTYSDNNIKSYAHGMFQSVYDYPYLSSSANHIFDISFGMGTQSGLYSSTTVQQAKKTAIYNQMAQVLTGFDETGSVRRFDEDGDFTTGSKIDSAFFINFSRLLVKDEIKKGTFSLELGVSGTYNAPSDFTKRLIITDSGAATTYRSNSPAGEYGILYASSSGTTQVFATASEQAGGANAQPVGLIYYQAGIALLNPQYLFYSDTEGGLLTGSSTVAPAGVVSGSGASLTTIATAQTIDSGSAFLRNRIYNLSFNNTTELNSTVYFCRVNHNEFNYSSNPTYLTSSQIRVKAKRTDPPVSYVTTIGLYSADRELLAVAKLSEPLRKDPSNELTLRVRLDY